MTFTETLFGGLLAVIALYFAARRLGVANYWAAVLSGALPFLAYLGYCLTYGFQGDVLAIHLAVFLATSGVLGVFGGMRRSNERMHWAPKLLIAFFIFLVVFNALLLSISMHGVPDFVFDWVAPNSTHHTKIHSGFSGALQHDRNNLYEPHMQRIDQQRDLGWRLDLAGFDTLRRGIPSEVSVRIQDHEGKPVADATVMLFLGRIANSQDDQSLQLVARGEGRYAAMLKLENAGNWLVEIQVERGKDTYLQQLPLIVGQ